MADAPVDDQPKPKKKLGRPLKPLEPMSSDQLLARERKAAESGGVGPVLMGIRSDPWRFILDYFGESPAIPKQREILEALRDYDEVHVPSCVDSTKTFTVARAVWWFLISYPTDSIVVSTAPTFSQVEDQLWREVHSAYSHAKYPLLNEKNGQQLLKTQLNLGPKWYAVGRSTDNPVNMQGFHASNILVILDEADGIPKEIWDALDGVLTSENAKLLAIGNPLDVTSEWSKRQGQARGNPRKKIIRITADDVLPYSELVTPDGKKQFPFLLQKKWVDDRLAAWGGPDSALAQGKIFAVYPKQSADTLIPLSYLIRARGRNVERGIKTLGVDLARYGGNRTVLTLLEGNQLLWSHAYAYLPDDNPTMSSAGHIISAIERYNPVMTAIDATGYGGGVVDLVRSRLGKGAPVVGVDNGAVPNDPRFANRGSEMWWKVREAAEKDLIGFSMDDPEAAEAVDELIADLNRPTYSYMERTSKIRVDKFGHHKAEATMSTSERSELSPDRGDSYVLAYNAAMPYISMGQKTIRRSTSYLPRSAGSINA